MTVRELIEMLSECNLDMEIVVEDHMCAMEITKVDGYEFRCAYTPHPDSTPCIGIKIGNMLGILNEPD